MAIAGRTDSGRDSARIGKAGSVNNLTASVRRLVHYHRLDATYARKRKTGPSEILKIGRNPWAKDNIEVTDATLTKTPWIEPTVT